MPLIGSNENVIASQGPVNTLAIPSGLLTDLTFERNDVDNPITPGQVHALGSAIFSAFFPGFVLCICQVEIDGLGSGGNSSESILLTLVTNTTGGPSVQWSSTIALPKTNNPNLYMFQVVGTFDVQGPTQIKAQILNGTPNPITVNTAVFSFSRLNRGG